MESKTDLGVDLLRQPQFQFHIPLFGLSVFKTSAIDSMAFIFNSPNNVSIRSVEKCSYIT